MKRTLTILAFVALLAGGAWAQNYYRELMMLPMASAGATYTIPTNGLLAWWTFDGTTNDSADSMHLNNAGATYTNGVKGVANTAVYFDGTTFMNTISTTGLNFNLDSNFTISVWLKTTDAEAIFFSKAESGVPSFRGYIFAIYDSKVYVQFQDTGYFNSWLTSTTVDGTWQHYVFSYNGTGNNLGVVLYLNGVIPATTLANGGSLSSIASAHSTYFGTREYSPVYYLGAMDEVRVYNRVLTSNEVWTIYQAQKP